MEKVPTGIPGFDQLVQGGFNKRSVNLIAGGPGCGKTIFCLQFLWEGITQFRTACSCLLRRILKTSRKTL
jgi:KaiC/GvpD/RAD55 family RecA-like ATPase